MADAIYKINIEKVSLKKDWQRFSAFFAENFIEENASIMNFRDVKKHARNLYEK